MTINENINYINQCLNDKKYQQILERNFLKKKEFEFVKYVNSYTDNKDVTRWIEKIYLIINNLIDRPKCKCCDNKVSFKSITDGHFIYCSSSCATSDIEVQNKLKSTMLERYGVENSSLSVDIQNKKKQNCLEKYGVESTNQVQEIKEKMINTIIKRYGVDNISQLDSVKENKKQSNLKNYGYEYQSQRPEIKEKICNTNIMRYGVKVPIQNIDIREKMINTCIKRYGTNNYLNSDIAKSNNKTIVLNKKYKIITSYLLKDNLKLLSYNDDTNMINCNCSKCNQDSEIKFQQLYLRYKSNREICTICNPTYGNTSYAEKELLEFITNNYNDKIICNTRDIISPYELDIFLPELNLAFEFNGLYWHSELFKQKGYHKMKNTKCHNIGIQLINIFEDDWEYKQEIVKSIILNKLSKSERIYARKCVIKELSNVECKDFLNNNHIQGYINATTNLGLYYKDELISLMTFSERKLFKNEGTELLRFCNKLNTSVIGGASKLFKHFIDNYVYESIISYSNNDIGFGNMYDKLGFTYVKETVSNYWWVIDGLREYRFKWNKQELIRKELLIDNETENDCMYRLGYYRIFDSGSKVWKFIKNN